jgi:hypothetical protein
MFLKNANFKLEIRHELNGFPEMGGQTDRLEGAQIFSRLYNIIYIRLTSSSDFRWHWIALIKIHKLSRNSYTIFSH